MPPKLLLKFNMAVIKEIPISGETTSLSIGRKEDNDIVIDNPAISSHHAKIVKQGNSFFIEDLNSTNGTFITGKKILKAELHHNMQVDIARHSLVLIWDEEAASGAAAPAAPISTDQTVVMDFSKQKEMFGAAKPPQPLTGAAGVTEKIGCLRIVDGIVDKTEVELTNLVTYIGTDEAALVKIRGGGIFGASPKIAALINKRPEGYIFKAMKEGYPKVNGNSVKDSVELKDGNVIETGKTKMVFFFKDKK